MDLIAYPLSTDGPKLRPAPLERLWMDGSNQRFAYRCLPLNIANQYGWEALCPCTFEATWDGTQNIECITIKHIAGPIQHLPISHFGEGVLTFHPQYLFRTPPGYDLLVTGPVNSPKHGITPLTGIIETDKTNSTFTMNWIITRSDLAIRFSIGDPFMHFYPVKRAVLEEFQPRFEHMPEEVAAEMKAWSESRSKFNADLKDPTSDAVKAKWQKDYFRASTTKVKLRSFV